VLEPGRGFYIWGGYANCANYPAALAESGLYFSQALIWVKEHPVLTPKDFMGNHEWCVYGWREGAGHWFAFGLNNVPDVWQVAPPAGSGEGPTGDKPTDVGPGLVLEGPTGARIYITSDVPEGKHTELTLAEGADATLRSGPPSDVWRVHKVTPQKMVHLTEKPVELATRAIHCSSRHGDRVLDLFGGSGSTLIGCEQTGRHARLMELDPLYCDVIVQRWEAFTGRKAERQAGPKRRRRRPRKKAAAAPTTRGTGAKRAAVKGAGKKARRRKGGRK